VFHNKGIDNSIGMLEMAKQRIKYSPKNEQLLLMDSTSLDFEDKQVQF
jgi:ubiquinone/menaquinone biosynthesis C-methylase UbiE